MYRELQGRNHQGKSFKGQNLSGADFCGANIQGADFTNANLTNANFSHAEAGLPFKWVIINSIAAAILSAISGWASVMASYQIVRFLIIKPDEQHLIISEILSFLLILAVNIILLSIAIRKGIQKTFGIVGTAVAVGVTALGILSAIGNDNNPFSNWFRNFRLGNFILAFSNGNNVGAAYIVLPLLLSVAATIIVMVTLSLAVAIAAISTKSHIANLMIVEALVISAIATGIITRNGSRYLLKTIPYPPVAIASQIAVIAIGVGFAIALILFTSKIAWQVLAENEKYLLLHQLAIFLTTIDGTSFRGANLTNANFSYATLKSTDFRFANTTRTLWHKANKLDWAIVNDTILEKPNIRNLLVSGNGYQKLYQNANLRGANLIGSDLSYANLKEADLSEATLEDANLEWANLTQIQAINTNFNHAKLTGTCGLATWNIDSTTQLEWVDCRWVYLLEFPKEGTDDRERRPSSGEFAFGEFTSLFQSVLHTVDLIFRNGIDVTAFTQSFQQVQVENEGTPLDIQSIENKGDGIVVVKVKVPPNANKAKIHSDFMQIYAGNLKAIEQKYQAELKGKEILIDRYHQQNADLMLVIKQLVTKPVRTTTNILSEKIVVINLGNGDFSTGFAAITAQIWLDGHPLPAAFHGKLPAKPEIAALYQQWQSKYENLRLCYQRQGIISRIKPQSQVKQVSIQDIPKIKTEIKNLAADLKKHLNSWLNAEEFSPIKNQLRTKLNTSDEIRVIIQTEDIQLRRIPWHLWDFLADYRQAEVAFSPMISDRIGKSISHRSKVRILAILGNSKEINLEEDKQILENLPDAETVFLVAPTRQEFDRLLWEEQGWDILCFSGHSSTKWDGVNGWIYINQTEKLSIEDLENALQVAIERGLHLAIFNSCDGLGLARHLDNLHVPQIIVMREPVPDIVAQEFLKHFLTSFSSGKSLYYSVREAREKLQSIEGKFPCASWLPVLCQNQAEVPHRWQNFISTNQLNINEFDNKFCVLGGKHE